MCIASHSVSTISSLMLAIGHPIRHSQEAEKQLVFEVRSYERMVAKTISLNSRENKFHQR